jgi:hypothetical protein
METNMESSNSPARTFASAAEQAAYQAAINDVRTDMAKLALEVSDPAQVDFYNKLYWEAYSQWLSNNYLRPVWANVLRLVCMAKNMRPLSLADNGKLQYGDLAAANDTEANAHDRAIAEGMAFDAGAECARKGVHELFLSEAGAVLPGLTGEKAFCRFEFFEDRGDASVGISGHSYWALAEDQTGTELEDLLQRVGEPA